MQYFLEAGILVLNTRPNLTDEERKVGVSAAAAATKMSTPSRCEK
jgi:hypothetical protein